MGLIMGFMLDSGEATVAHLYALASAYALMFATMLFANQRGYIDKIPAPPMVIFPTMIALCLAGALI